MANWLLIGFVALLSIVYLAATWNLSDVSISDPLGPKAFPYLVGALGLISAFWLWVEHFLRSRRPKVDGAGETLAPPDRTALVAIIAMLAWTLLFYLVLEWAGFILSCAVYLIGMMAVFNRNRWIANLIVSIGLAVAIKLTFSEFLGIPLPKGPLPI